jgi:hypothetical protein
MNRPAFPPPGLMVGFLLLPWGMAGTPCALGIPGRLPTNFPEAPKLFSGKVTALTNYG